MSLLSPSFFWLGILLILRAAFSQSAPQYYQDNINEDDEELLIDKLAAYIASRQSQQNPSADQFDLRRENYDQQPEERQQQYLPEFDLDSSARLRSEYLSGFRRPSEAEAGFDEPSSPSEAADYIRETLTDPKLHKFGYTPDEIQFYLPKSAFPKFNKNQEKLPQSINKESENLDNRRNIEEEGNLGEGKNLESTVDHEDRHFYPNEAPPMKKKQAMGSELRQDPEISYILHSPHSADQPGSFLRINDGKDNNSKYLDFTYFVLIAGCSAIAVVGLVAAGFCYYKIHERVKSTETVDYGVTGPNKDLSPNGSGNDRKLAQSAHMYHYQHQKQQMAALQKTAGMPGEGQGASSDVESDEDDNEDNDYTVYECPGLAPPGEIMSVENPLFTETPATPGETNTTVTKAEREDPPVNDRE